MKLIQRPNPLSIIFLASFMVGAGLSMIDWGDPDGVHGSGWPIPTRISGLPDDAPPLIQDFSNLGLFATVLNGGLALLGGFFLWAVFRLVVRIFNG